MTAQPTPERTIEELVDRFARYVWPLSPHNFENAEYSQMTPWEAHVEFESIHPFVDGNGRTGRMLMWWDEIQRGNEPTLIKAKDRFDYYDGLERGRDQE